MQITKILVTGKVQGVGYRVSTKAKADQLEVLGTVENLPNGSVKIVAFAPKKILDKFAAWAQEGPKYAEVLSVSISTLHEPLHFEEFEILR